MKPHFSPSCDRPCVKMADCFASQRYSLKKQSNDRMIKRLLNSVIAKYRDFSVSRRSIICLSLRLWQIIDLLANDKSRYFAQSRPINVNYLLIWTVERLFNVVRSKNACVGSSFQFTSPKPRGCGGN